jgi:hypothetical protein
MNRSVSGISCYIVLDSKLTAAGLNKVYFRIKENRVKRDLHTGIKWPREFF